VRDSESLFAFTTERYKKAPLITRREAAGAALTASGVFADIQTMALFSLACLLSSVFINQVSTKRIWVVQLFMCISALRRRRSITSSP
jgi:hypothetical protein